MTGKHVLRLAEWAVIAPLLPNTPRGMGGWMTGG